MALNHLGTDDPPPLARVALRAYLDFHQTALDEWRDSGLDREALLALLERTLTATVAAVRDAELVAHHVVPDEHRLGHERDAEGVLHAGGDLAREGDELGRRPRAAVGQRERVLARRSRCPRGCRGRGESRRAR